MDLDSIARAVNLGRGYLETIAHADVRPSPIHGNGLFAAAPLPNGTVLGTLDGQHVAVDDAPGVMHTLEWNALSKSTLLVRPIRTSYGYMNHSRTPNVRINPETLQMIALHDIARDEELLIDYLDQPLPDAYLASPRAEYLRA